MDAGLGWSYLLPFEYEYGAEARWLTMLWIAGLAAPAMYWATRAGRTTLLTVAAALALALAVIPLATPCTQRRGGSGLGLAIGACIGALVGGVSVRSSRPV